MSNEKFETVPNETVAETHTPPPQPAVASNPLLDALKIPGETVALPSRGAFYQSGELAPEVTDGEVHIYPMTAIDEIVMRSPDKLFSGDAIVEVFKRCIPQIGNPLQLLAKDADYLMVALRKISYGSSFEIAYNHYCENSKEHTYVANLDAFLKKAKNINPQEVAKAFSVTMPNGQQVLLQPIRLRDVLDLMQANDAETSAETTHKQVIQTLLGMIRSVDGIKDRKSVAEWLNQIQVGWIKDISNAVDQASDWGIDFTITEKCKDCGEEVEISVPLNPINFFT